MNKPLVKKYAIRLIDLEKKLNQATTKEEKEAIQNQITMLVHNIIINHGIESMFDIDEAIMQLNKKSWHKKKFII